MTDDSLRNLSVTLRKASQKVVNEVEKVIFKGSMNIKEQLKKEAAGHEHFPLVAATMGFDIKQTPGGVVSEIGPRVGSLAGIAYFGSSRPGGATLPDPKYTLNDEAPAVERHIGDVMERLLK